MSEAGAEADAIDRPMHVGSDRATDRHTAGPSRDVITHVAAPQALHMIWYFM